MAIQPRKKINKKQFLLLGTGLVMIALSIFLIVYSLTFLIKNINLILKSSPNPATETHFNISGAEKLFPSIQASTSTTP
ncbi:MAG: hypothetical protein GYA31_02145 [Parcubacteria group bacterium]|nr:hypothetical protein [Parcubacteria group bacterium]